MLAHMQGMILHGHPSMHPSTFPLSSIIYHLSIAIPVLWWLNSSFAGSSLIFEDGIGGIFLQQPKKEQPKHKILV